MNRYIKKYSPLIIISVSIIIFILMIRLRPEAKFEEPKIIPQLVETMVAYPSEVGAKINSQGTIRPEHEIFVTSELSGKVTWVSKNFLDGAGFKIGDTLLFGRESAGVPKKIHEKITQKLKIPMIKNKRSLNLATSVGIVLAEQIRQIKK